jgi:tetratricopeptide (TPR) repeat protein
MPVAAALAALVAAAAADRAWLTLHREAEAGTAGLAETLPLPLPPLPPRIAQGEDYDRCLGMVGADPHGAEQFAESWQAKDSGDGDGPAHCLALARIALGEPAEGAARLQRLADNSQRPGAGRAVLYDQAAQAWLMASDPARALAASDAALALSPGAPDLLMTRAAADTALGHWQDAVEDLTALLRADPRRPDALVLRSAAWRQLGRLDAAEDDVDRALALDAESAEALLERGILRQRRNDTRGARADWEHAIAVAPDTKAADLAEQNLALLEAGPSEH